MATIPGHRHGIGPPEVPIRSQEPLMVGFLLGCLVGLVAGVLVTCLMNWAINGVEREQALWPLADLKIPAGAARRRRGQGLHRPPGERVRRGEA